MDLWDYYFGVLASWRLHPGYLKEGAVAPSFSEIADMVNEMLQVREKKCPQLQVPQ